MKQLNITVLLSIVVVGCGKKTQNMTIGNETLKEAKESKTQQTEELLHQLHDSILKQTKTIEAIESQVNQFNSRLIEIEEALKQNSDKQSKPSEAGPASISTKDDRKLYSNKKPVGSEEGQVDGKTNPKAKPKPSSNDLWQAASNGDLEAINILHKAENSHRSALGRWFEIQAFNLIPGVAYFLARPYTALPSTVIVSGLVPSTSVQGPFTFCAVCSSPSKLTVTVPSPLFTMVITGAFTGGLASEDKPSVICLISTGCKSVSKTATSSISPNKKLPVPSKIAPPPMLNG
ncbi:hypothetical protein OAA59_00540 [bacterium]|nr:hypothetical protein [bacterium]